ncbi:MAG: DM13 domain-containing protein [Mycobacterium sp.]
MRSTALTGAALLTIAVALAACSTSNEAHPGPAMSPSTTAPAMSQSSASGAASARTGTFGGLNDKHVAGTATVTVAQIVLSGFSSDAGPDLHIYLTNGTDENAVAAGKELGSIAFDKSSQTFSTNGADSSKYTTVVIHCDKAKAVFGAAGLT